MYLAATNANRGKRKKQKTSLQLVEKSKKAKDNKTSHGSLCESTKRRKKGELSLIEQLPKEILQEILFFSRNCSLPLTSCRLALCLTSTPVFLIFSMNILHVDVGGANPCPESQCRLFSCRFFTFEFFKLYINWAYDLHVNNSRADDMEIGPRPNLYEICYMPTHLRPYIQLSREILMPEKLFREIWKDDKMHFLRLIFRLSGQVLETEYLYKRPLQRDSALQGLKLAVSHNESGPFSALQPWLKKDPAAWQDLLEHSLNIANASQSILACILDFSCLCGYCIEEKKYSRELALRATDDGKVVGPRLLLAIKNHEAKHKLGYRSRRF